MFYNSFFNGVELTLSYLNNSKHFLKKLDKTGFLKINAAKGKSANCWSSYESTSMIKSIKSISQMDNSMLT